MNQKIRNGYVIYGSRPLGVVTLLVFMVIKIAVPFRVSTMKKGSKMNS